MKTEIVFRKNKTGDITAVFLNEAFKHYGNSLVCYAHIGQHGECSMDWLYQDTMPATKEEYQDLFKELTIIYDDTKLIVKDRLPPFFNVQVKLRNME